MVENYEGPRAEPSLIDFVKTNFPKLSNYSELNFDTIS